MRANEYTLRVGLAALLCLLIINVAEAYIDLPRGTCNWVRPATEYRPEREFQGVWGRLSDGSIICFSPGRARHKEVTPTPTAPVCTTTSTEVCEDVETCEEECGWEKTWKYTCRWQCPPGKMVCNHGWVWDYVCEEECHFEQECHKETSTTCQ